MAQHITLEEAAQRLGVTVADFKRRHKTEWTHLVPMRDGATLRFRVAQIDDLARQLGAASDPSLSLAHLDLNTPGSDDFKVVDPVKGGKPAKAPPKPADDPLLFDSSDDDIFSLTGNEVPAAKADPLPGTDSDARLQPDKRAKAKPKVKDSDVVPTEEISLDLSGPGSAVIKGGSSSKLSAPKSSARLTPGDSGKKLNADSGKNLGDSPLGDSSEFELSLDADSDDFELQLNPDSSDEVDLGSSPVGDTPGSRAGKSGVNLRNPGDSGVSLEKGGRSGRNLGAKPPADATRNLSGQPPVSGVNLGSAVPDADNDSDVDFDLSLEDEPSSVSGAKIGGPRSGRAPVTSDSDSEFELTLDDSEGSLEAAALAADDAEGKGDIFETDFEIPPMSDESGSEAVAIDSDTDLDDPSELEVALADGDAGEDEESGSQVVVLEDEDDAPVARAGRSGRKLRSGADADVDLADVDDDGDSAGAALAGVKGRRRDADDEDDDAVTTPRGVAAPAPWGPLPALILAPAFLLVIIGGLMGYELLHTMTGYQQARKPTAPLVRAAAKALDMELKEQ